MGLGKTLTMIALIAAEKQLCSGAYSTTPSLILVPPPRQSNNSLTQKTTHVTNDGREALVLDTWEEQLEQ
jgi:hypothetical protein